MNSKFKLYFTPVHKHKLCFEVTFCHTENVFRAEYPECCHLPFTKRENSIESFTDVSEDTEHRVIFMRKQYTVLYSSYCFILFTAVDTTVP